MTRPVKRDVSGVLLLNKPTGITSNGAMIRVRGIYRARKAGHTGALDPLATGMLPVCLGEATKFARFLLDSDKEYEVTARFGQRTATSDAEGEIVSAAPVSFGREELLAEMAALTGRISQTPSIYSALKYQGRPYYEYARKGVDIPREAREVTVYSFELADPGFTRAEGEVCDVAMKVRCSKGVYVRTLVDDLGEMLGCGAHVVRLHRTRAGGFAPEGMVTFEKLSAVLGEASARGEDGLATLDSLLLPPDAAVGHLPAAVLDERRGGDILLGRSVAAAPADVPAAGSGLVRIYAALPGADGRRFLGVGEIRDGRLFPKRLITSEESD